MKKLSLLILLTVQLSAFKSNAQDSTKTLIHLPPITSLGLYWAPEYQYGQLKNQFTSFAGGSLMFLMNKKLAIGVSMQNTIYRNFSPSGINPLLLRGGFVGVRLEYTYRPDAAIHLSFPLVIGAGFARTDSANYKQDFRNNNTFSENQNHHDRPDRNTYFIIQPGLQLEGNLFRYVKLFAGANYRFSIPGYETQPLSLVSAATLQGVSFNIGMKLGLFDFKLQKKKI